MSVLERLQSTLPDTYDATNNPILLALLKAIAQSDEEVITQIQNARDQLFIKTASGQGLEVLANSRRVKRPENLVMPDSQFRQLIPLLSRRPKQIRKAFYDLADLFWEPTVTRANVTSNNAATWDLSVGDEIKVKIDNGSEQSIIIKAGEIATGGAATADEVEAILNRIVGATASQITNPYSGDVYVNVRTDTRGSTGAVEFISSSALDPTKLDFDLRVAEVIDQDQRFVVYQVNHNEIIMDIPAIVPQITDTLKGSHHFHADETLEMPIAPANGIWEGSFLYDPNAQYELTSQVATLTEGITEGVYSRLIVDDNSTFEESSGQIVIDLGIDVEGPFNYVALPNTNTIQIDPTFVFRQHNVGAKVNVVRGSTGYSPAITGEDLAVYIPSPVAAREALMQLLCMIKAAGVKCVFNFLVTGYKYLCDNPYTSIDDPSLIGVTNFVHSDLPVASVSDPREIANLLFWFDFTDTTTLNGGSITDGAAITAVDDKNGGNSLAQTGSGTQFLWSASAIDGSPAARKASSSTRSLEASGYGAVNTGITMFYLVADPDPSSAITSINTGVNVTGSPGTNFQVFERDLFDAKPVVACNPQGASFSGLGYCQAGIGDVLENKYALYCFRYDGTNTTAFKNGFKISERPSGVFPSIADVGFDLDAHELYFRQVFAYSRALTDNEVMKLMEGFKPQYCETNRVFHHTFASATPDTDVAGGSGVALGAMTISGGTATPTSVPAMYHVPLPASAEPNYEAIALGFSLPGTGTDVYGVAFRVDPANPGTDFNVFGRRTSTGNNIQLQYVSGTPTTQHDGAFSIGAYETDTDVHVADPSHQPSGNHATAFTRDAAVGSDGQGSGTGIATARSSGGTGFYMEGTNMSLSEFFVLEYL